MPLAPGTRFGPYEIVSAIGAGGMGEVYRARDSRLDRDVALKILPTEVAADVSRRARFEQEARAVAALNHPNIVAVYDVGDGYIVSELVDGEILREAKFGLRRTLDIAAQIASGLAAAHAAGIVHRDLKPENVLVTKDGRAKILDFGLARMGSRQAAAAEGTRTFITEPGVVLGTVGYMSPEQVRGQEADHRSDIFSFGVMLHEMLGTERPFQGETSVDTMQAILRQDPRELPRTVPVGVREVVEHCLEKDAGNRFQSARDLGFALHALSQADSQSEAAVTPILSKAVSSAFPTRNWLWIAALLLAVAASTFFLTRWLAHPPPPTRWSAVRLGGPQMSVNPRLSPDGQVLAFQAFVNGNTQVAVMKPESGNWNVLTHRNDRGSIDDLCWSADGNTIYFSRNTDVPQGVFSIPFLGGEERMVLENADNPAALPDGSLLVARINQQRRLQLVHFWPETGKLQELPVEMLNLPTFLSPEVSPDGHRAVVFGSVTGKSAENPSLVEVDLVSGSARSIPLTGLNYSDLRTYALAPDGRSILAAFREKALTRILRISLDGRGAPQDLFMVTSDVWAMDAAPDGSVFISPLDRPAELVSIPSHGGQPVKVASFPQLFHLDMVVVLTDGRAVVPALVSGHARLVAVEPGKDPVQLVNTPEDTASPMTAMAGNRIAFAIGREPQDTIAIADASNGRITVRISPQKGDLQSLAASADGATLYFTAGGTVWSVASSGGDPHSICPGDWVVWNPARGTLIVARNESLRINLFEVPAMGGTERSIPPDHDSPLFNLFVSPGTIRSDGQMLVPLNVVDSWFNPLGQLDLQSGRVKRLAGDPMSDLHSAAWTRDGGIVATRETLDSSIWRFSPEHK
ncbi:MAG TPA: protein kinase [Candidatus Koribacter sp.]|jgi:serine/threonine protein kinase